MKALATIILSLNVLCPLAFAGPGISSGDEPEFKPSFICSQPELQDASLTTAFADLDTANPVVRLFIPTGETSGKTLRGICKQLQGADELYLTCSVKDGHVTYLVTLASRGASRLYSTVETKNTHLPKIQLDCEQVPE